MRPENFESTDLRHFYSDMWSEGNLQKHGKPQGRPPLFRKKWRFAVDGRKHPLHFTPPWSLYPTWMSQEVSKRLGSMGYNLLINRGLVGVYNPLTITIC